MAALGIVNTLAMNVLERVRELAVLRATGLTRRQAWRLVVLEAAILGLVGALLGALAGLATGAVLVQLAGGAGVPYQAPWAAAAAALGGGIVLAVVAALYPARLASRVEIVGAARPGLSRALVDSAHGGRGPPTGACPSMSLATERLNRLPAAERGITIGDFLVPIAVGERLSARARHIALVVAGALLIALTANLQVVLGGQTIVLPGDVRVTLPTSPVPITAQTFAVLLVGGALGLRRGFLAWPSTWPSGSSCRSTPAKPPGSTPSSAGRTGAGSWAPPAATCWASCWRAPSWAGWPSWAGTATSAGRSWRCSSATS